VIAMTPNKRVYHRLNLVWGVIPILLDHQVSVFEDVLKQTESILLQKNLAQSGDKILIMAGIPMQKTKGTNFLKIHRIP
jgi:pyruvate kinase